MFLALSINTCPAQQFFTNHRICFRLMFFLRRAYLDPPTTPSGSPRCTFFALTALPTAPSRLSEFFPFSPTLTWFWVTSIFTILFQIPAAPYPKGSLSSQHATSMPLLTSRTIFSTPPGFTPDSLLTPPRVPLSWISLSRIPPSPPSSHRGTPPSPPLARTTFHVW